MVGQAINSVAQVGLFLCVGVYFVLRLSFNTVACDLQPDLILCRAYQAMP